MGAEPDPEAAGRVIVTPDRQIDMATAPQLGSALAQAQRDGATEIVVDLTAVDFLDSSGIGVLLRAANDAGQAGVSLYVHGAHGGVARVLEISGVSAHLPPPPDR